MALNISKIWKLYFLCVLSVFVASCHDKGKDKTENKEAAITVTAETVERIAAKMDFTVSGNIEGVKTVNMGFLVSGRIASIHGEEGSLIRKGALIAALEPTNYAIAKEMADVQVAQASDEYERLKLMYERKSISESDFKKSQFTLDGAKAQLKLREKDLSDTRLYAEIGGMLLKKRAEEGEIVSSGMPILTLADISRVKVIAYIPENRLKDIKIGQEVAVSIDAIDKKATGKISEVGGVADPATRSFTVKTEMENPDLSIRPGMIAEVSFISSAEEKVLAVRTTCLLHTSDDVPYLYVIDHEKGRAYRRTVSIGRLLGDYIEIVSGLEEGEAIVSSGKQKLSNGSRISISKQVGL